MDHEIICTLRTTRASLQRNKPTDRPADRARRRLYILPLSRVQIGFRSCGQNYGKVQGFLLDVGQDGTAKVMLRTAEQDTNMGAYKALCSMLPEVPRGEADHVFALELGYKVAGMVGQDVVMQHLYDPEVAWYNNHDPGSSPPRTSKCQLRAEILSKQGQECFRFRTNF